jgi:hypothetical protein
MKVFLTWDYELYFGSPTGTAESCMTEPTDALLEIGRKTGVPMTYFVDCGYLLRLTELKNKYSAVKKEYGAVVRQLEQLVKNGNEVQLHIHPHWEDSFHDGEKWRMNVSRYKLSDFSRTEAAEIISTYKQVLEETTQTSVTAYRAGGWCIQPFGHIAEALFENGIRIESSVFRGGDFKSDLYDYDFRDCPKAGLWRFDEDPCLAKADGRFTELPISDYVLPPWFFWQLFAHGRVNPALHKPLGNGKPVPSPGTRKRYLTRFTNHYVSLEGYFVTRLPNALRKHPFGEFTALGHPKACTRFSLDYLSNFLKANARKFEFLPVSAVSKP